VVPPSRVLAFPVTSDLRLSPWMLLPQVHPISLAETLLTAYTRPVGPNSQVLSFTAPLNCQVLEVRWAFCSLWLPVSQHSDFLISSPLCFNDLIQ
jgi:hypothetical protein